MSFIFCWEFKSFFDILLSKKMTITLYFKYIGLVNGMPHGLPFCLPKSLAYGTLAGAEYYY